MEFSPNSNDLELTKLLLQIYNKNKTKFQQKSVYIGQDETLTENPFIDTHSTVGEIDSDTLYNLLD